MTVVYSHKELTADNIYTFYFKPSQPVKYTAGQFIELRLPHKSPDSRGDKRWFTLSSSPTEDALTITTKISEPSSTFKKTLLALKAGKVVHMSDAMGDFVLPKDAAIPLIFVAGGIGITPVHSIVQWLIDRAEKRDITIIYAAASASERAFLPLFKQYALKLIEYSGDRLSAEVIIDLVDPPPRCQIYLSGPEPMIEALVAQFDKTPVGTDRLVTDYFVGYKQI